MTSGAPSASAPGRIEPIDAELRILACLADIHGNTAALDAVLESEEFARADVVAVLGCATTGPDPLRVLERLGGLDRPVYFLAGNGERALIEMASGRREVERPADEFQLRAHHDAGCARASPPAPGAGPRETPRGRSG
jgi:hypothetical protein